jgi:hypothetical protein
VFIKPERKSLVLFQNPTEKGQRVLMLNDKFWMLMPKSRRPIRITPLQKLLGEASTGDIATLKWSEDYEAEIEKTENNQVVLWLRAKVKGVTYKNIRLFLQPVSFAPIKAEFYVTSGKFAKSADFILSDIDGQKQVTKMILKDKIKKNRRTEVVYNSRLPHSLDNKFYNPSYLIKNPQIKF